MLVTEREKLRKGTATSMNEVWFAHGVGRVYEWLPVWLYLVGAAATVLISFVIPAVADRKPRTREPRVLLSESATAVVISAFRVGGLAVLGLLILFTFFDPDAVRSHITLTVLMSLFTVSALWLLSLPLVTD